MLLTALCAAYFLSTKSQSTGAPLPSGLFDFTETEPSINPNLNDALIPKWKAQGKVSEGGASADADVKDAK